MRTYEANVNVKRSQIALELKTMVCHINACMYKWILSKYGNNRDQLGEPKDAQLWTTRESFAL